MRYIQGRDNLSCTIFVPWDCNNHCKFCTSKAMYKTRECSMDAILYQIKKINENPVIKEFVLTGGEPLADINKLQILLDAIEKPVYVNTTFPLTENKDEIIKFLNNSNIAGINISRHIHQSFYENVLPFTEFYKIKIPIKMNVVISQKFDINEFMEFIEPLRCLNLDKFLICLRADYRNITKDNLKNRDDVFDSLMDKFEYLYSGGCMVCNDDRFYDDDFTISYHRGMEQSLVSYGRRRYVNDVIVTIDGMVYPDWNFVSDIGFEKWLFGAFDLDDDMSEYEKDTKYIEWIIDKKYLEMQKDKVNKGEIIFAPSGEVYVMDMTGKPQKLHPSLESSAHFKFYERNGIHAKFMERPPYHSEKQSIGGCYSSGIGSC